MRILIASINFTANSPQTCFMERHIISFPHPEKQLLMKEFTDQENVYSEEDDSIADASLSRKFTDQELVHKSDYILRTKLERFSCFSSDFWNFRGI